MKTQKVDKILKRIKKIACDDLSAVSSILDLLVDSVEDNNTIYGTLHRLTVS